MKKIIGRLRLLLLYLTTIALLAGQGASAHIHLSETHHHDGIHHQHSAEVHTDHFTEHDTLFADHANVIELDSDYRTPSPEKQKKILIALAYEPPVLSQADISTRIKYPPYFDGWLAYNELSTRRSRAPPNI